MVRPMLAFRPQIFGCWTVGGWSDDPSQTIGCVSRMVLSELFLTRSVSRDTGYFPPSNLPADVVVLEDPIDLVLLFVWEINWSWSESFGSRLWS